MGDGALRAGGNGEQSYPTSNNNKEKILWMIFQKPFYKV